MDSERAIDTEEPISRERAINREEPSTTKRAIGGEESTNHERAPTAPQGERSCHENAG